LSRNLDKLLSFAKIDERDGKGRLPLKTEDEFPLPAWHRSVYNLPFCDFQVEDLCRACEQRMCLEEIVPFALRVLENDPLADGLYDGHVLVAVCEIPGSFWSSHPDLGGELLNVINRIDPHDEDVCENVKEAIQDFLRRTKLETGDGTLSSGAAL
jgi:hypothetical protein